MLPFVDLGAQQKIIRRNISRGIKKVLNHGQYILGKEVSILEDKLAEYVGVKHCIGTSSGTDALTIALMAKDIKSGDEVITTPFTFVATAGSIVRLGAKPIFVDIEADTYNIDSTKIEACITSKTKAVVAVGLFGQCPDMDSILKICQKHKLAFIEDAAQSFGAEYKEKKSCSMADISCTSFFPAKPLGCYGDGGACFTNDDSTALIIRQNMNHGQNEQYQYIRHGLNSRLDTLQAAILLEKLKIFPEEILRRREVARRYDLALKDVVQVPVIADYNQSVYAQYTIETKDQKALQKVLLFNSIPAMVYYPKPLHLQPVFLNQDTPVELNNAESASKKVLSIPLYPYLTKKNQAKIIRSLLQCLEKIQ